VPQHNADEAAANPWSCREEAQSRVEEPGRAVSFFASFFPGWEERRMNAPKKEMEIQT
jgi:hypothetical protein